MPRPSRLHRGGRRRGARSASRACRATPGRWTSCCDSTSASRRTRTTSYERVATTRSSGFTSATRRSPPICCARPLSCGSAGCTRTSDRRSTSRHRTSRPRTSSSPRRGASPTPVCRHAASSSVAASACRRDRANRPQSLDVGATLRAATARVTADARRYGIPAPRIEIEPGRAVIGPAGTTLYRVLATKRQTRRTFVVVDGGIAENPRPALYGAHHHVVAGAPRRATTSPRSRSAAAPARMTSSESSRFRAACAAATSWRCARPAPTRTAWPSNYNRFPRPAVVAVADGSERAAGAAREHRRRPAQRR